MNKMFQISIACLCLAMAPPLFGQVEGPGPSSSPLSVRSQLEPMSKKILAALKNKNGPALASLVDPDRGLRFLPNLWDEFDTNVILQRKDIATIYHSRKIRQWGAFDGSGDPIRNTASQFMRRFVWNTDYLKVKEVEWRTIASFLDSSGRVLDPDSKAKILSAFPQAQVVTYSFPGVTGPQGGAMDWTWLVLILVPNGDQWFLTGIAHHEWKI